MTAEVQYRTRYEDGQDFIFDRAWEHVWDFPNPHVVSFSVETMTPFSEIEFSYDLDTIAEYHDLNSKFSSALFEYKTPKSHTTNHTVPPTYIAYRQSLSGTKRIWLRIISGDKETVADIQKIILTTVKPIKAEEETVKVKFWHWGGNRPDYNVRHLDAPTWDEIRGNYSPKVVDSLAALVTIRPEDITGGRLAILHGPPGTGKTTAIRALCREWKKWCNIDYIVDPESFFGNAMYMTECLMSTADSIDPYDEDDEDDDAIEALLKTAHEATGRSFSLPRYVSSPPKTDGTPSWRLLIIEDAEEFMNPDAKAHVGQALSRLLNVGDGFIGQGLNILILLTTNTKMADVHPAIKRAGRTFANIEVPSLSKEEAAKWLGVPVAEDLTLAELYEKKNDTMIGDGIEQFEPTGYL